MRAAKVFAKGSRLSESRSRGRLEGSIHRRTMLELCRVAPDSGAVLDWARLFFRVGPDAGLTYAHQRYPC